MYEEISGGRNASWYFQCLLTAMDWEISGLKNAFLKVLLEIEMSPLTREAKLRDLLTKNEKLKESLLEIEMQTVGEIEVYNYMYSV